MKSQSIAGQMARLSHTSDQPRRQKTIFGRGGTGAKPVVVWLALLATFNLQVPTALAQGTAFTYQGRLSDGANPANGHYDFQFILFAQSQFGNPAAPILTNANIIVNDGLFTATLDFGSGIFTGANYWLDISARTNGTEPFTELQPRQPVTPSPYALFAGNVGSGGLSAGVYSNAVSFNNAANNFSGSFTGNGAGVANVNAATLGGLSGSSFWQVGGNAGTSNGFIGTTDDQLFEVRVNNIRVMRYGLNIDGLSYYTNAPNVIGGSAVNTTVTNNVVGATIGGGGGNYVSDGSSHANRVTADFGTIGGGLDNSAKGTAATVGGGADNTASGGWAMVGGGSDNTASGPLATVGGGEFNTASAESATVGGGYANVASDQSATVGGGEENKAISQYATVGGGEENTASDYETTVGGGTDNTASFEYATVSGGIDNTASGDAATVSGGGDNIASGSSATVPGGWHNTASGDDSFAAGTFAHAAHNGSFVWADDNYLNFSSTTSNQFRVRSTGGVAFVTGIDSSGSVTSGVHLLSGDAAWSSISDRNAKKNFRPVNGGEVLEKLAAIPVEQWNYKWEGDTSTPHIGPMAQDFIGAFYPGRDDKSISTLEFDGVELAAIQGLNRKLDEQLKAKDARIDTLEKELLELKEAVRKLSK